MSIQSITDAIMKKAEENAASTVLFARKERDEKLAAAKSRQVADEAALTVWLESEASGLINRRLTLARLESRIAVLGIKQKVIEKAYALAAEKLENMPANEYARLFTRLVTLYAEKGDELAVGRHDAKRLNAAWAAPLCKKLGLKARTHFDGRGVILSSGAAEKDISLPTLIVQARERTESRVAEILFGKIE